MRFRSRKPLKAVVVILILTAALGGCGRRGRLEPPPDPNAPPAEASDVSKAGFHKKPVRPPILPPNAPFILDPLLK